MLMYLPNFRAISLGEIKEDVVRVDEFSRKNQVHIHSKNVTTIYRMWIRSMTLDASHTSTYAVYILVFILVCSRMVSWTVSAVLSRVLLSEDGLARWGCDKRMAPRFARRASRSAICA